MYFLHHFITHNGEKPFERDQCHKVLKQKNDLTKHVRIHSGGKPFKCEQCDKNIHTDIYPD